MSMAAKDVFRSTQLKRQRKLWGVTVALARCALARSALARSALVRGDSLYRNFRLMTGQVGDAETADLEQAKSSGENDALWCTSVLFDGFGRSQHQWKALILFSNSFLASLFHFYSLHFYRKNRVGSRLCFRNRKVFIEMHSFHFCLDRMKCCSIDNITWIGIWSMISE